MDNDVYRGGIKRYPVPAQEQIRLGSGVWAQHRRVMEVGIAGSDDAVRYFDGELRHYTEHSPPRIRAARSFTGNANILLTHAPTDRRSSLRMHVTTKRVPW